MAVFQRLMLCFSILLISACSTIEQGKKLNSNEADAFKRFVKVLNVGELREIELNQKFDDFVLALEMRLFGEENKDKDIETILKTIGTAIDTHEEFELKGKASPFLSQLFYMNEGGSVNRAILYYVIGQRLKLPIGISVNDNSIWVTWKTVDGFIDRDVHFRSFYQNRNSRYTVFSPDEVVGFVYEGIALKALSLGRNEVLVLDNLKKASQALPQDILAPTLYEYYQYEFKKKNNCDNIVRNAEKYPSLDYTNYYAYFCLSNKNGASTEKNKFYKQAEEITPGLFDMTINWGSFSVPWDSFSSFDRVVKYSSIMATFFRTGDFKNIDSSIVINNKLISSIIGYEQASRLQGRNASQFFSVPFYSNSPKYSTEYWNEYFKVLHKYFLGNLYLEDEEATVSQFFDQRKINSLTRAILYISLLNEGSTNFKLKISKGEISVLWESGDKLWNELKTGSTSIKGEHLLVTLDEVRSFFRENTARRQFAKRFGDQSLIDAALVNATGAVTLNPQSLGAIALREEILSEVDGIRSCQTYNSSLLKVMSKNDFHFYFSNCLYSNLKMKEARSELSKAKQMDIRAKLLDIKLDMAEKKNSQALAKLEKLKGQAPVGYSSKIDKLLIILKK